MAIQFRCAQCGHPIEVDEQHAGQTAACPYCRHVMSVPQQSTYQPDAAVPARPLDAREPIIGSALPAGEQAGIPLSPRQQAARRFGGYALSCMLLALALFAIGVTRSMLVLRGSASIWTATQPTAEQMRDFEHQIRQVGTDPWVAMPGYGCLLFALVGLVLGIVSLTQAVSGNWRGLVTVIVCGLFFLCQCAGAILALSGFGAAAAG
jgi:DNA-directed RNA polymerase subunit RPC12/RpoP